MKLCTGVEIKRLEGFVSHVHLTIKEVESCKGDVITLIGKGFFAGITETGFLSTEDWAEAIVFQKTSDAQRVVNLVGLYPQPEIYSFDRGYELVKGWLARNDG